MQTCIMQSVDKRRLARNQYWYNFNLGKISPFAVTKVLG